MLLESTAFCDLICAGKLAAFFCKLLTFCLAASRDFFSAGTGAAGAAFLVFVVVVVVGVAVGVAASTGVAGPTSIIKAKAEVAKAEVIWGETITL